MKILVKDLAEHPVDLSVDCGPEHLELTDPDFKFTDRVTGLVTFQLVDGRVLSSGKVHAIAETVCVRCLKPISVRITASVEVMYEKDTRWLEPAAQFLGSEDEFISYFDGETVRPEAELREAIMMELPSLPLCDESCRGLCPRCGTDLNVAPCQCDRDPQEAAWKNALRGLKLG